MKRTIFPALVIILALAGVGYLAYERWELSNDGNDVTFNFLVVALVVFGIIGGLMYCEGETEDAKKTAEKVARETVRTIEAERLKREAEAKAERERMEERTRQYKAATAVYESARDKWFEEHPEAKKDETELPADIQKLHPVYLYRYGYPY